MTLEQAGELALRAAEKDDVEQIRQALEARAEAIGALAGAEPTEELAAQIRGAIEQGEQLRRGLQAIKHRAGLNNARLEQIRSGLAAAAPAPHPKIDCRG